MALCWPIAIIAFLLSWPLRAISVSRQQQAYLGPSVPFEFRDAVLEDAADIATVMVDAFSPSDPWEYVYQFRDQYPGVQWECAHQFAIRVLQSPPSNVVLKVIAVPDRNGGGGGGSGHRSRVVSFAAWRWNTTREQAREGAQDVTATSAPLVTDWSWSAGITLALNCSAPPDANMTRVLQLRKAIDDAGQTYIEDVYPWKVYLDLLATHPDWDGNGFGATHLRWGLALADARALPTVLMATPAGYPLYKSVGFEGIHNVTVERLDGEGIIWYEAMARDYAQAPLGRVGAEQS